MSVDKEVLVVGETLTDIIRKAGLPEKRVLAGAPMNVARTIERLEDCSHIGARLISTRSEEHFAIANIDEAGNASYEFSYPGERRSDLAPPEEKFDPREFSGFYAGSISSLVIVDGEKKYAPILDLLTYMHAHGVLTFYDPNIRPSIIPPRETARAIVSEYAENSFIVKCSDEDLLWLYGEEHGLANPWTGPRAVIITRGGESPVVFFGDEVFYGETTRPAHVVDTVGAGDSFMGALIVRLLLRCGKADDLTREILEDAVAFASKVAAINCERAGADPPWASELD
jgi:fructokinase